MKNHDLALMKNVTRPMSRERAKTLVRPLTSPTGVEEITLEDAGLANEVRSFKDKRKPPDGAGG